MVNEDSEMSELMEKKEKLMQTLQQKQVNYHFNRPLMRKFVF